MNTIAYCSPFVPAEWIAAHGLHPIWARLHATSSRLSFSTARGICPFAAAIIDEALSGIDTSAIVLTTVCDQMRYAAAVIETRGACPVFLMNVPSTWQTAEVRKLYLDELKRLGRFLMQMGGKSPGDAYLAQAMLAYNSARFAVRSTRDRLTARQFAKALAEVRGPIQDSIPSMSRIDNGTPQADGIRLAVLGGPVLDSDHDFFEILEHCGGRVVLDATEGGERTMPRPFDGAKVAVDPMQELADAYFDGIPDAFRRPNNRLYQWLGSELAARKVRGIIFRRYVWCDLWHAELHRLKKWSPAPVLEIDVGSDDAGEANRMQGRIEAFLEMLG